MKRSILFVLVLCAAAQAQTDRRRSVRSWFADGTGIEIYTETTGPTHPASNRQEPLQGVIGIVYDKQYRLVMDKDQNILFGYFLDGRTSTAANAEFIRISPIDASSVQSLGKGSFKLKFPSGPLPTVDTVREFPAVKIGQVVTLDILFNPSTGEKLYEVIRPLTEPSPAEGVHHPVVTGGGIGDQLSLKEIALRVNGQSVDAPVSWMIGGAARIDVPGHGLFVVSASDPKDSLFHATAQVSRQTLTWNADGDRVEITSKTNVLGRTDTATLWVYHDPHYKSTDSPNYVVLQTADSVEWLLPKR
jgi:hypothetical protein